MLSALRHQAVTGELLSDKELQILGYGDAGTFRNWRIAGKGPPYHKVGRLVRYRRADVEEWLASHRVVPAGG